MKYRRDPERLEKMRVAVRFLLERNQLRHGHQAQLAQHFQVSRQRVNQIVTDERLRQATSQAPLQ